jgi:hypothetical protein
MFAIMGIAGNVGGAVSNTLPSIERRFGAYFGCLTTSPRQTDEVTAAFVFLHSKVAHLHIPSCRSHRSTTRQHPSRQLSPFGPGTLMNDFGRLM